MVDAVCIGESSVGRRWLKQEVGFASWEKMKSHVRPQLCKQEPEPYNRLTGNDREWSSVACPRDRIGAASWLGDADLLVGQQRWLMWAEMAQHALPSSGIEGLVYSIISDVGRINK